MWIGEGIPEYFCPLKVSSRLIKKGDAELPARTLKWTEPGMVNDLRMYDLLRINSREGEVAKSLVKARELTSDEYALSWGLVHYLASKRQKEFQAYLQELCKLAPLDAAHRQLAGRIDPLFVKHFGEDFATLESSVREHLLSRKLQAQYLDPKVNQTHYIVRRVFKKGKVYHAAMVVTTSPAAARKWKEEQEGQYEKAKFFTKICKTQRQAEFEMRKFQQL
jgi:hypothetical protein